MYGPGGCGFNVAGFGTGFMFPFGWFGILFIALGIFMMYRILSERKRATTNVHDILDMKYANGEIDEELYLKKKRILAEKKNLSTHNIHIFEEYDEDNKWMEVNK